MLAGRAAFAMAPLVSSNVLAAAGFGAGGALASSEVYDPDTGVWAATGALQVARYQHTLTPLTTMGRVLAAGAPD
jgi:hypothetical protein